MIEPPADQPSVVVVVPTYNERPNIEALILALLELGPRYRIVVVDDGSPDGTGVLADALVADHPERVEVIHRAAKGGLGPAYIAGFRRALQLAPRFHRPDGCRLLPRSRRAAKPCCGDP